MTGDRRRPVARYVLFSDEALQQRFADAAESAYQDLARLDQWSGPTTLALGTEKVTERRGFLRRAVRAEEAPTLTVTAALAAAGEIGREVPRRVAALNGCTSERALAATMARVGTELVGDLAEGSIAEQREHPAYRQTLRLAAELQALHVVLSAVGCHDGGGCVRLRPPEQWGRRVEDVEVAEVRAVLLELAESREQGD